MRGDFARAYAVPLAAAASLGFVTTLLTDGNYGDRWRLTPSGLHHLWDTRGLE